MSGLSDLRLRWLRRWPEVVAVLAGAVIVLIATNALGGGAREPLQREPLMRVPAQRTKAIALASKRVGAPERALSAAVRVATIDWLTLDRAGFGTSANARRAIERIAAGTLRVRLAGALPTVAARIQARVARAGAPAAFESWPLGYQARLLTASEAVVSIWHLDVAATSALGLAGAEYQTSTLEMRRVGAGWRVEAVNTKPGPTPPNATAPQAQVDAFALAANGFKGYRNEP
jgi:hypothetical protein